MKRDWVSTTVNLTVALVCVTHAVLNRPLPEPVVWVIAGIFVLSAINSIGATND